MATQTHTHKEADEKKDNDKKEAPITSAFAKGKHDAELIQGGEVPAEEQGRVNESREWLAAEAERQEKADLERFKSERSHAARKAALQEAKK
jgi:hypothetical protein